MKQARVAQHGECPVGPKGYEPRYRERTLQHRVKEYVYHEEYPVRLKSAQIVVKGRTSLITVRETRPTKETKESLRLFSFFKKSDIGFRV